MPLSRAILLPMQMLTLVITQVAACDSDSDCAPKVCFYDTCTWEDCSGNTGAVECAADTRGCGWGDDQCAAKTKKSKHASALSADAGPFAREAHPLQSGSTCGGMEPFCAVTTVTDLAVASTGTTANPSNNYGCLGAQPVPNWYYLDVLTGGALKIDLVAPTDIDYALWGPYSSPAAAKAACGSLPGPKACSYSSTAHELVRPSQNFQAGETWVLLITNFAQRDQTIQIKLVSGHTAVMDCTAAIAEGNIVIDPTNAPVAPVTGAPVTAPPTTAAPATQAPVAQVSVGGDPFTSYGGKTTQFYLPLGTEQTVITCPDFELRGRTKSSGVAGDTQQWFDRVTVLTGPPQGHRNIVTVGLLSHSALGANSTAQDRVVSALQRYRSTVQLAMLNVTVDGVAAAEHDVEERRLASGWKVGAKRIGHAEVVTFAAGAVTMRLQSAIAKKFTAAEDSMRHTHIDVEFDGLDAKPCTGVFPEIWGVAPMSAATERLLTPP